MNRKTVPLSKDRLEEIAAQFPTPFHLYDEKAIRANARNLLKTFSWMPGFKEYFAVKACPNPHILKLLAEEGFGTDCSSLPELILSEKCGITGENIMFTSNNTPENEFLEAKRLGAIINLDDFTHIDYLEKCCGIPELICFRFNPGPLKGGNAIIGHPEEAKYGLTKEQLVEAYKNAKEAGAIRFGLHTMVASNELDPEYFVETARLLFEIVVEINKATGIRFEFVNLGGGIGIPYRPEENRVDLQVISDGIRKVYDELIKGNSLDPLNIVMENGRMITGPYGYLVTRAIHKKDIYKNYIGVDASMANLMRPGLYGAYHHITVMGKEDAPAEYIYDVVGSLCENNDKFAIDRELPRIDNGDLLMIHDAGAHGFAMGFNYNGKLRSAELLLREDGSVQLIRRAETMDDYFATLEFDSIR